MPLPALGTLAALVGILVPHAICTIFIAARAVTRLALLRKWFVDDTLILLAWIFSSGLCAVYLVAAESPGIQPAVTSTSTTVATEGTEGALEEYWLLAYWGLLAYQLCSYLTKLSVLAFYLRMFNSYAHPWERRLTWATTAFVMLYSLPLWFMSVFQCHPAPGLFFGAPMKCFTFTPLLVASASLHIFTDACLIVMVVPAVLRLRVPPRQKAALAVVLSLGVLIIAAGLTRLVLGLHADYLPAGAGDDDVQPGDTLAFFIATVLECDVALICASAPTLRLPLARLWPRIWAGEASTRRSWAADRPSSANLTAVSYHGYPWEAGHDTPVAGGSRSSMGSRAACWEAPRPPPPVPSLPSPPTPPIPARSPLRSMRSMTPSGQGSAVSSAGDDGVVLLSNESFEMRRVSAYYQHFLPPPVNDVQEWRPKRWAMYVEEREQGRGVGKGNSPVPSAPPVTAPPGDMVGAANRLSPMSALSRGSTLAGGGARSSSGSTIVGSHESLDAMTLTHFKSKNSEDWGWDTYYDDT